MIELHEKIDVPRPLREAFRYVADFRTTPQWDATAIRANKSTPGPPDVGTRFTVRCALPVGSVELDYTLTHLEPEQSLELVGDSRLFSVHDIIHFTEYDGGTRIDYRARFTLKPPLSWAEKRLRAGLERMGRQSVTGLRDALEDDFPPPEAAPDTRRADRWVLPGVLHFSRYGYRRGRRRWRPLSASLEGRHAVITGANSGIGLATARALAERGAQLTLVIRDESKAAPLLRELERETGNQQLHVELADLSLISEIDRLSAILLQKNRPVDLLINNAGALFDQRKTTGEGIERSLALLLLSPWHLTNSLLPLLGPGSRVLNVVSGGMYTQTLRVDRLELPEAHYSGSVAYARAKRALMVLTEQWADAWAERGIVVNAMHPGWADTPGVRSALPGFHRLTRRILRSPEEGADTLIWLAAATEAGKVSGRLFLDREPRPTHLRASTREDPAERERLQPALETWLARAREAVKPSTPETHGVA